ncbi:MAG: hypothetical protein GXO40_00965 [Epsilonproteobacteria bacterium]|nr:hypothetical protein [Campylobacterota bacterium]
MADIQEQILSFGEVQEPHTVVTIAYAGVRLETEKLYTQEGTFPTDAYQQVIIYLQQQCKEMDADGVKNIEVKVVTSHDSNSKEVMDFIGSGTIIKLKRN